MYFTLILSMLIPTYVQEAQLTTKLTGREPVVIRKEKVKKVVLQAAAVSKTKTALVIKKDTKQIYAILEIVKKESTYNPYAQNPSSTSSGLNGFLNSTWKGVDLKKSYDPLVQMEAMFRYIDNRYKGYPTHALTFHIRNGWY